MGFYRPYRLRHLPVVQSSYSHPLVVVAIVGALAIFAGLLLAFIYVAIGGRL